MFSLFRPSVPVKPTRNIPLPDDHRFGEGIFPDDEAWHAETSNGNATDYDVIEPARATLARSMINPVVAEFLAQSRYPVF